MAKTKKSENVPNAMQEKFDGIVASSDDFAKLHLNSEYAQLIRFAISQLCVARDHLPWQAVRRKLGLVVLPMLLVWSIFSLTLHKNPMLVPRKSTIGLV